MKKFISIILICLMITSTFAFASYTMIDVDAKIIDEEDVLAEYGGVYHDGGDSVYIYRKHQLVFYTFLFEEHRLVHSLIYPVIPVKYKGYICLIDPKYIHNISEATFIRVLYNDGINKCVYETRPQRLGLHPEDMLDCLIYDPSISEKDILLRYIASGSTQSPSIGMTADEMRTSSWGKPSKINKTTYAWGTEEQWVYPNYKYAYFEDGYVTSLSEQLE